MRKVELCSDEMKIVKKNLAVADIWEDMKWDKKSSDEMSWDEVQVWSVECGVWRVQCEEWRKCSLGVALHRGRAQVLFYSLIIDEQPDRSVGCTALSVQSLVQCLWSWGCHVQPRPSLLSATTHYHKPWHSYHPDPAWVTSQGQIVELHELLIRLIIQLLIWLLAEIPIVPSEILFNTIKFIFFLLKLRVSHG